MEGLTEGRIVHYVLPSGRYAGEHRAAIIIKVWRRNDPNLVDADGKPVLVTPENGVSNITVISDASNDGQPFLHMGSVINDPNGAPGTWHWIEKA